MGDVCFSPGALGLLASIWIVLQGVIATLFWLAIRALQDSTRDAREVRDRALDLNEQQIPITEKQTDVMRRAIPRGKRS